MPSFGSGLAHALTGGITGYQSGVDEQQKKLIVLAAQKRQEERQRQQDELARIGALTNAAQAGLEIDSPDPVPVKDAASMRSTMGKNPTSPEAGEVNTQPAEPSQDGTVVGQVGSHTLKIPQGGLVGKSARDDAQKQAQRIKDRYDQLNAMQETLDPKFRKSPSELRVIAANETLHNKYVEDAMGLNPDRAPVMGTPEWERAKIREAQIGAQYGYHPPHQAGGGGITTTQNLRLSTMFDNDPIIKNAKDLAQGIAKVRASATDPSAAGDLSLLYGYNKILDPGSVVRESEFAMAAKSGSLPQQIQAAALKVVSGQRLTKEQRADFIKRADQLARAQQALVQETVRRHEARAKKLGADPSTIVYDPFDETMGADPSAPPTNPGPSGTINLGNSSITKGSVSTTHEQQLWDAAVAKHGKEKVMREIGPRP